MTLANCRQLTFLLTAFLLKSHFTAWNKYRFLYISTSKSLVQSLVLNFETSFEGPVCMPNLAFCCVDAERRRRRGTSRQNVLSCAHFVKEELRETVPEGGGIRVPILHNFRRWHSGKLPPWQTKLRNFRVLHRGGRPLLSPSCGTEIHSFVLDAQCVSVPTRSTPRGSKGMV